MCAGMSPCAFPQSHTLAAHRLLFTVRAPPGCASRRCARPAAGAVRELRRDAVFLADERDAERASVDAERLASERGFYAELQRQEADMRSGGQGGMNPHLRKKKGGGKK